MYSCPLSAGILHALLCLKVYSWCILGERHIPRPANLLPSFSSWARFVRVCWTARRSNQSILKHITPEYSLEGLMLNLKPQYFGDLMWRTDSLEKIPMLGKIEGRKRRGWERMKWLASPTQWTWVWASSGNRWCSGKPGVLQSMGMQRVDLTTERPNRTDESSKYSCHSYIFWMSWSLALLQGWFPYGGKEGVIQAHISLGKLYEF